MISRQQSSNHIAADRSMGAGNGLTGGGGGNGSGGSMSTWTPSSQLQVMSRSKGADHTGGVPTGAGRGGQGGDGGGGARGSQYGAGGRQGRADTPLAQGEV